MSLDNLRDTLGYLSATSEINDVAAITITFNWSGMTPVSWLSLLCSSELVCFPEACLCYCAHRKSAFCLLTTATLQLQTFLLPCYLSAGIVLEGITRRNGYGCVFMLVPETNLWRAIYPGSCCQTYHLTLNYVLQVSNLAFNNTFYS